MNNQFLLSICVYVEDADLSRVAVSLDFLFGTHFLSFCDRVTQCFTIYFLLSSSRIFAVSGCILPCQPCSM